MSKMGKWLLMDMRGGGFRKLCIDKYSKRLVLDCEVNC